MAILMHLTVRESYYVHYENSLHNTFFFNLIYPTLCIVQFSMLPPPPPGYIPGDLPFFLTYILHGLG